MNGHLKVTLYTCVYCYVEYMGSEAFLNLALTQACLFYFVVHLNNHFSWKKTRHMKVYMCMWVGLEVRISHRVVVVEPSGYRAWLMDSQTASLCISPPINERRRHTICIPPSSSFYQKFQLSSTNSRCWLSQKKIGERK